MGLASRRITKANFARSACLRCGKPILKGSDVEKAKIDGYSVYVHAGCTPRDYSRSASAAPAVDVDDVVEKVMARVGSTGGTGPVDFQEVANKVKPLLADELSRKLAGQLETATRTMAQETAAVFAQALAATMKNIDVRLNQKTSDLDAHFVCLTKVLTEELEKKIKDVGIVRVEIKLAGGAVKALPADLYHSVFPKVMQLAQSRRNIFLPGPAGCGKSHLARQLATALDLPFGMISLSGGVSESKIVGRSSPNLTTGMEVFKSTQFTRIYKGGGVYLFDEIDNGDANVLVKINSAIANGVCEVDDENEPILTKHPDFIAIAAANTFGNGADRMYVGRNQLDLSTLDRFRIGMVPMNYCPAVEDRLCPDKNLRTKLLGWRERIEANRIPTVLSTRFMADAYVMQEEHGWNVEKEIADSFFAGWRPDDVRKIRNGY